VEEGDVNKHVRKRHSNVVLLYSRYRDLESIDSMAIFLVQRPADGLVEILDGGLGLLGDMAHDGVHHLALVVSLFAFYDILSGDSALGKINVSYHRIYPGQLLYCSGKGGRASGNRLSIGWLGAGREVH